MNEKIHFDDFVEQVALESGFDVDTARAYVESMFETIIEESAKGRNVKIQNFGSFQPRWYKAKRGINPQTQQALEILPHYHIHYAVSKGLKETLNSGEKITKITIDEKPNILGKIIIVALLALLGTLLYRSFFMPEVEIQPLPIKEVSTVEKEAVTPKEKDIIVTQEQEEPIPVITKEVVKEVAPVVVKKVTKPTLPTHYKVRSTETLSEISLNIYGNSIYWPQLFLSNQSKISSPDLILKGTNLIIPKQSEKKPLYSAYLAAYKSYLNADKFSQSFWTLCSGAKYLGQKFVSYLSKNIHESDLKVIKKCHK